MCQSSRIHNIYNYPGTSATPYQGFLIKKLSLTMQKYPMSNVLQIIPGYENYQSLGRVLQSLNGNWPKDAKEGVRLENFDFDVQDIKRKTFLLWKFVCSMQISVHYFGYCSGTKNWVVILSLHVKIEQLTLET